MNSHQGTKKDISLTNRNVSKTGEKIFEFPNKKYFYHLKRKYLVADMIPADWNVLGILTGEQVNYKAGPSGADIVSPTIWDKNMYFIIIVLV